MNKLLTLPFVCMLLSAFVACDNGVSEVEVGRKIELFSVTLAAPCKTDSSDTCEYGILFDDRDGQNYKTVKIGDQWWMAENLNFETENSYCFNDQPERCEKYGRLYTWSAAMDSAFQWSINGAYCGYGKTCTAVNPVRGVCPAGWHLPTEGEWKMLFAAVGDSAGPVEIPYRVEGVGKKLKSTMGWQWLKGSDDYGFSLLGGGNKGSEGFYLLEYRQTDLWTSSEDSPYHVSTLRFSDENDVISFGSWNKHFGLYVRCLKDN